LLDRLVEHRRDPVVAQPLQRERAWAVFGRAFLCAFERVDGMHEGMTVVGIGAQDLCQQRAHAPCVVASDALIAQARHRLVRHKPVVDGEKGDRLAILLRDEVLAV
jgi:hypothetical protein